jgi:hypothetical protein
MTVLFRLPNRSTCAPPRKPTEMRPPWSQYWNISGTDSPIRVFHTVIFDTRGGSRLIHLTAPYRFARLFAHRDGRFRWLGELTFLDDTEFDPEPIQLSFDDLKRRGPTDRRFPALAEGSSSHGLNGVAVLEQRVSRWHTTSAPFPHPSRSGNHSNSL